MAEQFAVTEESTDDDRYIVAVDGEVDLFTSAQLRGVLVRAIDEGHDRLVIDLCGTTSMDSSGMAALLTAYRRMTQHPDGRIVVSCASDDMMRVFKLAQLHQILRFEPSREAALDALAEHVA
jgi:anti-sigma B factor antagonist